MKAKACAEVDIKFTHIQLSTSASADEVIAEVKKLNVDESVSGILVQLPLGEHVSPEDERSVTEAVDPKKDVDGYVYHFQCPSNLCDHQNRGLTSSQVPCLQYRPFIIKGL